MTFVLEVYTRVSQKTQKSEFCFATNPSGFHRLDEPPEKIQHYRPINDILQAIPHLTILRAPKYAPKYAKYGQICQIKKNGSPNVVYGSIMLKFFLVAHLTYENQWG